MICRRGRGYCFTVGKKEVEKTWQEWPEEKKNVESRLNKDLL